MTKKVRTITGDVPPEALGRTLIHEHLCVDWGDLLGRPKVLDFDRDEMADRMVAKMDELYASGIGAMTECTPIGTGRYLDLFHDVARRSKVKLICSTGFFHESWAPMHLYAQLMDIDQMAALFVREITEGMGETLLKAGLIKCATGEGPDHRQRKNKSCERPPAPTNRPAALSSPTPRTAWVPNSSTFLLRKASCPRRSSSATLAASRIQLRARRLS